MPQDHSPAYLQKAQQEWNQEVAPDLHGQPMSLSNYVKMMQAFPRSNYDYTQFTDMPPSAQSIRKSQNDLPYAPYDSLASLALLRQLDSLKVPITIQQSSNLDEYGGIYQPGTTRLAMNDSVPALPSRWMVLNHELGHLIGWNKIPIQGFPESWQNQANSPVVNGATNEYENPEEYHADAFMQNWRNKMMPQKATRNRFGYTPLP